MAWKLSPGNLGLLSAATTWLLYGVLAVLFVIQAARIWQVNADHLRAGVPDIDRYRFKQVAALDWAYFVTFGSELAVVSMLPLFFMDTFNLSPVTAGLLASGFAFMNLVARPGGGYLSDRFGRKRSLSILIAGLAVGYLVMAQVDGTWWIPAAVVATTASGVLPWQKIASGTPWRSERCTSTRAKRRSSTGRSRRRASACAGVTVPLATAASSAATFSRST